MQNRGFYFPTLYTDMIASELHQFNGINSGYFPAYVPPITAP